MLAVMLASLRADADVAAWIYTVRMNVTRYSVIGSDVARVATRYDEQKKRKYFRISFLFKIEIRAKEISLKYCISCIVKYIYYFYLRVSMYHT